MEEDFGYKFATWRRSLDRTALDHGNYYHNDYEEAKRDFACRSGLVQYTRQFTDEQLTELYGKALLEQENAAVTHYGRLEREDGQPIQAMEQEPEMGGMEGMQ